ncbi:MAG: glycosyltransferase family 4 protein [Actinobacteria bacterium]|nr:glycosyltransferase family 4 protein [Actinomycetota bacterium]
MTADTVGGVWTYALDLADALAPHGVEVQLATMGRLPDGEQRAAVDCSAVAGLYESGYALEWEDDPRDDVDRAGAWLLELADELRPDIVHLNGYVHANLSWPAPVVVAAHSDVLSWWRAVRRTPAPASLARYRDRVAAGLRHSNAVCAPTQAVLDDLAASYAFEARCEVVPNGRAARATARVAKEQLVVGLGRFWDEGKNVAALQRIAARAPWPVLLAGPGSPLGRISSEETASLLARASIFVSPARYEPFGLAALEAAQAGCALVLGDIASLREVWGDAAAYASPDDDEAILAAVCDLCANRDRRLDLAARAQRRASRYTPEAMAAGMRALYTRVLAQTPVAAEAVA